MKLGIALPFFHAMSRDEFVALVREAEARGYDTAWIGEAGGADAVTLMALIAAVTTTLRVAGGVIPVQTRTPVVLGMTGATLAHLAPGRVALGLGVSSRTIVEDWNGLPFRRPLAQLREAVGIVRRVMAGERVTVEGEFSRHRGFRLTALAPEDPVPIYLAALGPAALELAGEIADGVLLNWLAPDVVPASIQHLRRGAGRAGRTLEGFEIAAYVRTCVTDDPTAARARLARDITGYAIVDAYASFFRECGFAEEVDAAGAAWAAGDRAGAVARISPRMLDALGVVGDARSCREGIRRFAEAGLTMPVVLPFSADAAPAASLARTLRAFP
jgi:probable F420-dependent oxidoreductase